MTGNNAQRWKFRIQRFISISAFYPHFSVLSPFQRFIPISVSAFSFRFRDSVSAFYPYLNTDYEEIRALCGLT
jgi:hypothetical protein